MASNFLPHQIYESIPSYNGKTSCKKWIQLFDMSCAHFRLTDKWKLVNMERFLIQTAAYWWTFSQDQFLRDLTPANSQARYELFKTAIQRDFQEEDDKKLAQQENKDAKFNAKSDDPKEYIFKKLSILNRMDDNMSEESKVENLLLGLDSELKWSVTRQLGSRGTVEQFIKELKFFSETLKSQQPAKTNSVSLSSCVDLYQPAAHQFGHQGPGFQHAEDSYQRPDRVG